MKLISTLFHPLLMATYSSMFLYVLIPSIFSPIPAAVDSIFYRCYFRYYIYSSDSQHSLYEANKANQQLELTIREERIIPFITISCFYAASTYMFYVKMNLTATIMTVMLIATALIVVLAIISLSYKISIHAAGAWGICRNHFCYLS